MLVLCGWVSVISTHGEVGREGRGHCFYLSTPLGIIQRKLFLMTFPSLSAIRQLLMSDVPINGTGTVPKYSIEKKNTKTLIIKVIPSL